MEITEIKVFPVQEEKLKAFVSVVFDRCFMVNDIKIIQGRQGLFISMPSRKKKNGEFKDVAHPLNNDTRQMIEGQVLTEYDRVLEERAAGETSQPRRAPKRRTAPPRSKTPDAPSTDAAGGGEGAEATETATETRRRRRSARRRAETAGAKETTAEAEASAARRDQAQRDAVQRDEVKKTEASSEAEAKDTTGQAEEEETAEKTLEEIEEMHLRDSFWSVP